MAFQSLFEDLENVLHVSASESDSEETVLVPSTPASPDYLICREELGQDDRYLSEDPDPEGDVSEDEEGELVNDWFTYLLNTQSMFFERRPLKKGAAFTLQVKPFDTLDTPFRLNDVERANLMAMEDPAYRESPWRGVFRRCQATGTINWGDRRLYSELYAVPKYAPWFAKNPVAISRSANDEQNFRLWDEFFETYQAVIVNSVCDETDNRQITTICLALNLYVEVPVIKSILNELTYRVKYAYGVNELQMATPFVNSEFYTVMAHTRCDLEWRQDPEECICSRRIEGVLYGRHMDCCCYTSAWRNRQVPLGGVNYPIIPRENEGGVYREDIECIRIIQRLYTPLKDTNYLFWNPFRFSSQGFFHGLCLKVGVPFADVFSHLEGHNEVRLDRTQTTIMRFMVGSLLQAEFFVRGTPKALFPWNYFEVNELVPQIIWQTGVMNVLLEAHVMLMNGTLYDEGIQSREFYERYLSRFMSHKDLEDFVVRSVPDQLETMSHVFRCDICAMACSDNSTVILPIDPCSGVNYLSISRAFDEATSEALLSEDFCTRGLFMQHNNAGDLGMVNDHPLGEGCCDYHATRRIRCITYATNEFERVCWDCMFNKKQFLFLGRATFDGQGDTHRTYHAGAWWLDVRRVLDLVTRCGFKKSAAIKVCRVD